MTASDGLLAVLERSRRLGFLGPGSLRVQVAHAGGFAVGVVAPPGRLLDLGSGGGVPGLVLAEVWPAAEVVLLDASEKRCAFLAEAVTALGLAERVRVVRSRAEDAGRRPDLRAGFDLVVARGFGPPAVTAECGAPFLRPGGRLVVSEPPEDGDGDAREQVAPGTQAPSRWPEAGLAVLGLAPAEEWSEPFHYRCLVARSACPDRFPRRVGIPAKRPLF
ncbi:MAG TPA: RsmG family class I SAM-dependent methyltransferase [Acidimicrobiales bacterium]|nr:RsmG family class I SAM-dependent methyltransferase [Acidimicrobiales bacterium]